VFDAIGLFTPSLGRIKDGIGSTEDHDLQLRIWQRGMRGLYTPEPVAYADVTADRMTKEYHWRWHRGHGRHCALMRLREFVPADQGPMSEPADLVTLFGSPAFVYLEVLRNAFRCVDAFVRRKDPLFYAHKVQHICSYLQTRYHIFTSQNAGGRAAELAAFVRAYLRKRLSSRVTTRPAGA
jgi:hypothetical protein